MMIIKMCGSSKTAIPIAEICRKQILYDLKQVHWYYFVLEFVCEIFVNVIEAPKTDVSTSVYLSLLK